MAATDSVILEVGQILRPTGSRQAGFMGNIDIDDYDILSVGGEVCGRATVTTETSVKAPFDKSVKLQQYGSDGKLMQTKYVNLDA